MCLKGRSTLFILRFYLTIILVGSISVSVCSQDLDKLYFVSGKVKDESGTGVPFAEVYISDLRIGTVADINGVYKLQEIPKGTHVISVRFLGYHDQQKKILLNNQSKTGLDFILLEKNEVLREVVVYGETEKFRLENSEKSVSILETRHLKLRSIDLGEVLAQVQGVNVRKTGGLGSSTRFSLNGLTDDQVRFFLDGIPLKYLGYSFGIANVPVNLISRVEVFKGSVPIEFGADALGGAVNLVSPTNKEDTKANISYQTGSFQTHRLAADLGHCISKIGLNILGNVFFDATKNNYNIDVEVPDKKGRLTATTLPRFHDKYQAWGSNISIGHQRLSWADDISISGFSNYFTKDIQHNNIMTIPYGEVETNVLSYGGVFRYKKSFSKKVAFNISSGCSRISTNFKDVSVYTYNWLGERLRDRDGNLIISSGGEIRDVPTDRRLVDDNSFARFYATYTPNQRHLLGISIAPTWVNRSGKERLLPEGAFDHLASKRNLSTIVNGLEYSWKSEAKKFQNTCFIKHYAQILEADEPLPGGGLSNSDRTSSAFGIGNNLRLFLTEQLTLKASYECATRMPTSREIFGDARLIIDNLDLKPERSHNANFEIKYRHKSLNKTNWSIGINGFIRAAEDLIVFLGNEEEFQYQNVFSAISQGVEVVGNLSSADKHFMFEINGTFQDFRNRSKKGPFGIFKGDRIPNRPYFFTNTTCRYSIPDLLYSSDNLSIFASTRYVFEFYRSWASAGRKDTKQVVPSQLVHSVGTTYKFLWSKKSVAITAEIQNVTNEKAFDFFGVQRPGRRFFIKTNFRL